MDRRVLRLAPYAIVALAVGYGLFELTPELKPVAFLNDSAFHTEMIRFAAQRIREGHDPLTSWFSPINLGSPAYLHYQSLPSIITAVLSLGIGTVHAYQWTVYLLLATWPISVYIGARLFSLPRFAAAAVAALSPLMVAAPGVGYEWGSYLWIGWGVWTQLWAMWLMPLAWGFTYQAIARRRYLGAAMVCDGLVVCVHYLSGYMMALPIVVLPLIVIGRREFWRWLGRAITVGVGGLLVSSWVVFPVFFNRKWAARNEYLAGTVSANSFGAKRILGWFVNGQLFDNGRLPIMTVLVVIGLVVCLWRWFDDLRARALVALFAVALVAFFGRPTLGVLLDIVPGSADLFLRRFLTGVQMAALLLAGVGAIAVARLAVLVLEGIRDLADQARGGRLAPARGGVGAVVLRLVLAALFVLVYLEPGWTQLAAYARSDGVDISYQVAADDTTGVQVNELIDLALERGGGRIFAGQIGTSLGQTSKVGDVWLYTWLADQGVDAIGFTLRSASLMSNPEQDFYDDNPADYDMFAVRWLLLPSGTTPPVHAALVRNAGLFSLWSLAATQPSTGYVQVVDTQGTIAENRTDIGMQNIELLDSDLAAEGVYPTVAYDGSPAAPPTLPSGARPASSPGQVISSQVRLADGSVRAVVVARRRAVVLLKSSFDPGWHVEVDGRPASTEMVAPALVGVEVGPGRHTVSFTYVGYGGYPFFFVLTALTLLWLLARPFVARRVGRARQWSGPSGDEPPGGWHGWI